MEKNGAVPSLCDDRFEEWFLASVSAADMPVADMLNAVHSLRQAGQTTQADSWAELMEEALVEQERGDDVVRVLQVRAEWHPDNSAFKLYCGKRLASLYRNDPLRKTFVVNAGFDKPLPLAECFRRIQTLQRLAAGVACLDRTWGFGMVKHVDAFYERVTIDFAKKAAHEMSFAYAAETLQFVADDHLLARKHRDAAGLLALAGSDPAEVVRIVLRSYGSSTVARIQEILSDGIVKADQWKTFWDAARKALKNDPLVVIPAKRSEAIQLLSNVRTFDSAWYSALAAERTPDGVFARLDDLEEDVGAETLDAAAVKVIGDRLAFLLRGFGDKDSAIRVRVVLAARKWQVPPDVVDVGREAGAMLREDAFMACAAALSAKRFEAFLRLLIAHDRQASLDRLVLSLPALTLTALNVAVDVLLTEGEDERCSAVFRDLVGMRKAGVEVLYWLARRPERMGTWSLGTLGELAFQILSAMEKPFTGERLKAANQLVELVEQREWIEAAAKTMSDLQRTSFVRVLRNAMGRVPVDTQTMIGRLVMLYPELASLLEEKKAEAAAPKGGLTSWRSYRQRQQQLEKLINEEIPQNSRDIAQARSYGDLRENFEYKSAKEMQGILLKRRGEFEQSLTDIKGTDFSGCSTEAAGMGTRVVLRYPDGHTQELFILGEWDQDPALGIVSCSSKMGQVLAGRKQGDSVAVPTESGDVTAVVAEVGGLPEAIIVWARGNP